MRILAIDPGNTESAYVVIDHATRRPLEFNKIGNHELLDKLPRLQRDCAVAIEMVASYGMPVGADVFETCVWIGRFYQQLVHRLPQLVKRHPVKLHHCHSAKAKDSNITQALVDRFAPGQPNRGKGTKASPGWFYGFAADVWQAYALGVYVADTLPTSLLTDPVLAVESPAAASTGTTTGQGVLL
ncbi:hypothetical protein HZF07_00380 [Nocardioides sp. CGMCC 1.13656]|uniref:hypothetical protein n=1 Tax=Nocardioides TaxID=1839 RepID=UPI0015EC1D1B|nr:MULTISPECIES: hypothetical protein [unclassified Nocardioides]MBA2952147.1 hypothetical protein [Nocardioides sp. CGMCC 1.13656]